MSRRVPKTAGVMTSSSTFSVRDVCEYLAVTEHTVLSWIRGGELKAFNVGRNRSGGKPRWRITREALDDFIALRTPTPPIPKVRRRRSSFDVIEFIK